MEVINAGRAQLITYVLLLSSWRLIRGATVCYGTLGCFDNSPPFNNAGGKLPQSPAQVGTTFSLFTRKSKSVTGEQLSYSNASAITGTTFNAQLPVKIIVHGFTDGVEPWMAPMKDALLQKLDCNVITTNWTKGAAIPDYFTAAANTRLVGRQVAMLIRQLLKLGSSFDRVHIIGLSLGAHVAGYAGSNVSGQVGRISGLDPAGPLFDGHDALVRLRPGSGKFVDVIHTNGVPIEQGGFGISIPVGHVDFYPNGGKSQPGCPSLSLLLLLTGLQEIKNGAACSHARSAYLYMNSITATSCSFVAYRCSGGYTDFSAGKCSNCKIVGCSELGYNADRYSARGLMYLSTNNSAPYC